MRISSFCALSVLLVVLLTCMSLIVLGGNDDAADSSVNDLLAFITPMGHQTRNQQLLDSLYKLRIGPTTTSGNAGPKNDNDRTWMFRSTSGQLYECVDRAPAAKEEGKSSSKEDAESPPDVKPIAFSADALGARLELLRGTCVSHDGGWWTTRWCHATEVRQTHFEGAREVTSYSLGLFSEGKVKFAPHSPTSGSSADGQAAATNPVAGEAGQPLFYYQKFDHGQMCDETGEARRTEVRIYCCPRDKTIALVSLQETTLCHYTMTLCWASLCEAGLPALSANSRDTWAAIRPLTGLCLRYKGESSWTHEVCFEKASRAFRQVVAKDLSGAERKQLQNNQHRVLELDAKHLGLFSPLSEFKDLSVSGEGGAPETDDKRKNTHERVVRQVYANGDTCDRETGEFYETHVKIACFLTKTSSPEIVSVRWTTKCHSLVLMHAPGLCDADEEKRLQSRSRARQNRNLNNYIVEEDGDESEPPGQGVACKPIA